MTTPTAGKVDLPPYIYGREAGENERVWTESAVRALVAQLEAENARLRVDAERYRWLRDDGWFAGTSDGVELDAAIDAARSSSKPAGGEK